MNFEFADQINPYLEKFDFSGALQTAEGALQKLPSTPFHKIIGKSLTAQAHELAVWIGEFYGKATEKRKIEALYFEINEFDINTDTWYIDGFAYRKDGGLHPGDMDWLSGPDAMTDTPFIIDGYQEIQAAFDTPGPDEVRYQDAPDWCEQIVIIRFIELVRAAHLTAGTGSLNWAEIPVYCTEHSYDFMVKSDNRLP